MNYKALGDIGQNAVIGKLARLGIGVAIPLSDNYPFDLVAIVGTKTYRVQVKSSSVHESHGSVSFRFRTNNFYTGEIKGYSPDEVDVIIGYDLRRDEAYLFTHKDIGVSQHFTVRFGTSANNQINKCNSHEKYSLSPTRIKTVFNWDTPDLLANFSTRNGVVANGLETASNKTSYRNTKQYDHTCTVCRNPFRNGSKNGKLCSSKCKGIYQQKVPRPSLEELKSLILKMSFVQIGRKFGVSDNAVRKWAEAYDLPATKYAVNQLKDQVVDTILVAQ